MNSYYHELNEKTVVDYVNAKIDYFSPDAEFACNEIGDGNLNLVFRIEDVKNKKSIIVKQALPYVRAAGKDWALDINRGEIESKALKIQYDLTSGLVPKVYCFDDEMFCTVMEDLSDHTIMRYGLIDLVQYPKFADQISDFLVKTLLLTSDVVMDHKAKKAYVKEFINTELCQITEDLVYSEPFHIGARNDIEDDLVSFHKEVIVADEKLTLEAAKLKFEFMNHAQALLHGDLHTGSIFVNQHSTKVIDPEFGFYGPMGYDIGLLIANLNMNYISTKASVGPGSQKNSHLTFLRTSIQETIDLFISKSMAIWDEVVNDQMAKSNGFKEWYINNVITDAAGAAGCEMIRRTVGFAHVQDLDQIADDSARIEAKKANLGLGKALILNRNSITTGADFLHMLDEYL